jgi:hypothetical protein
MKSGLDFLHHNIIYRVQGYNNIKALFEPPASWGKQCYQHGDMRCGPCSDYWRIPTMGISAINRPLPPFVPVLEWNLTTDTMSGAVGYCSDHIPAIWKEMNMFPCHASTMNFVVTGVVELSGRVFEGPRGYVASRAVIRELWIPEIVQFKKKLIAKFENLYQCDVIPKDVFGGWEGKWGHENER